MKTLHALLKGIRILRSNRTGDFDVAGITADSRQVKPGYVFVAVRGTQVDGHAFIPDAIRQGALAIILDDPSVFHESSPMILVEDSASALGFMCHAFFAYPTKSFALIGITGTNGKTTIATLAYKMARDLGYAAGLVSTVENKINGDSIPSTHTTPDPLRLNSLFAQMRDAGCAYVFMEVSSHAAHQKRIAGLHFKGGVFTNITHDHLDYHETFDQYIAAKKSFFDLLPRDAFALVNRDDKNNKVMLQNCAAKPYGYALKSEADFKVRITENTLQGLQLEIDGATVHVMLAGAFNATNLLAVYAIGTLLGFDKKEMLESLSAMPPVEGRFDIVQSPSEKITGIIDYAHTPDAVEKVLATIREMTRKEQQLITVIGCGGSRDRMKRPVMARIAARLSDKAVFTSDNPRREDPMEIIREMEPGVDPADRGKYISIPDRREAIKTAVMLAGRGDVICLAGKGHEKYQEIQGVKYPFDDKQVLLETFHNLSR